MIDDPTGEVTYSPQDDKLRVYFVSRQSDETLAPLKEAGFRWAGAQECWHAHWSPSRVDAALEATGADAIDDEPTTLEDRAAVRAERFSGYAKNAAAERDARMRVDRARCEQLNGQPILIGHHSEKGHRALLRRMWANFFKAGDANKRSEYWARRASSPESWARYKDNPGVRARRIKTLEAELRRFDRTVEDHGLVLKLRDDVPFAALKAFCNVSRCFSYRAWSTLDAAEAGTDAEREAARLEVLNGSRESSAAIVANCERWREHLRGRIEYERIQLGEQGASHLLERKKPSKGKAALPLLNVEDGAAFRMTAAEYAAIHADYKGTRIIGKAYRRRVAVKGGSLGTVFLTDKKAHEAPAVDDSTAARLEARHRRV